MSPRRTRSTSIGSWPRRQLIALTFLLMIISATLLLTTVNEVEAKGMKKLKKLLKMKKLKKYLPLLLMGPRIIIITRDNDYGQQSYGGSGGSYGGGGSYDDGGGSIQFQLPAILKSVMSHSSAQQAWPPHGFGGAHQFSYNE